MRAKVNHTQTITDTWRVDAPTSAFGLEFSELEALVKQAREARPNSMLRAVVGGEGQILSLTIEMTCAMGVLPPG